MKRIRVARSSLGVVETLLIVIMLDLREVREREQERPPLLSPRVGVSVIGVNTVGGTAEDRPEEFLLVHQGTVRVGWRDGWHRAAMKRINGRGRGVGSSHSE